MSRSSSTACVIDASALLAFLHLETGHEKGIAKGNKTGGLREDLEALELRIISFTTEDTELAAHLWLQTKSIGLSLGDRACLAVGLHLGIPVITTDRMWSTLATGVTVE